MVILIHKQSLILKNDGKKSFSSKTKASMSFIPMMRMKLWCLILKRKKIITWFSVCPNCKRTLIVKIDGKEAFLMKSKHQCHLPQWVEWVYHAQSWNKGDYCVNPSLS